MSTEKAEADSAAAGISYANIARGNEQPNSDVVIIPEDAPGPDQEAQGKGEGRPEGSKKKKSKKSRKERATKAKEVEVKAKEDSKDETEDKEKEEKPPIKYVEAPLPKTNPWNKNKSGSSNSSSAEDETPRTNEDKKPQTTSKAVNSTADPLPGEVISASGAKEAAKAVVSVNNKLNKNEPMPMSKRIAEKLPGQDQAKVIVVNSSGNNTNKVTIVISMAQLLNLVFNLLSIFILV